MTWDEGEHVTILLTDARRGDDVAKRRLFELLYDELHRIAERNRYVGKEGETMQATALVNEAYIQLWRRIPPPPNDEPENRKTFFRTSALVMRTIHGVAFLALDEAMDRLEVYNDTLYEVVMHRYFAGRTFEQTAELMGMSESFVRAKWQLARGWLHRALEGA